MFGIMDNTMNINNCDVEKCYKPKRRSGEKTMYCDMHYARVLREGIRVWK